MFPHTVTVYSISKDVDLSTLEDVTVNHITILRGVLLDATKASNVRLSGLENADAVTLYVPMDVEAVDGITGAPKKYVDAQEFWKNEDKDGIWTFSTDTNTFFIKGEVIEPIADETTINMMYSGVYSITKIDEKDFGSLKHWEIGGT